MSEQKLEKNVNLHECTKCGNRSARCSWSPDSDGAAWTWITWKHQCENPQCRHYEEKEIQYTYNFEEITPCQICGREYKN